MLTVDKFRSKYVAYSATSSTGTRTDRDWKALPHVLSFLGIPERPWEVYDGWGAQGCKYSPEYLAAYINAFNLMGGVVSVDMSLWRNGSIDAGQLRVMEKAAQLMAQT